MRAVHLREPSFLKKVYSRRKNYFGDGIQPVSGVQRFQTTERKKGLSNKKKGGWHQGMSFPIGATLIYEEGRTNFISGWVCKGNKLTNYSKKAGNPN